MSTTTYKPRMALITGGAKTREEVDRYLPNNYHTVVVETYPRTDEDFRRAVDDTDPHNGKVCIGVIGWDCAGWTLDGYVIPRLASGLIGAREVGND